MQTCPLSHVEEGLLFHCLTLISVLLCVHLPQTSWLQMHNTKGCVFLPPIDFFLEALILPHLSSSQIKQKIEHSFSD